MALTNATTLADYGAGIGTQGATLKVDATNKRVGVGTDSPAGPEGSLQVGTGITFFGNTGIVSAIGGKFSGDFTVGGTLTYEDVANIDAVGIITAQSGVSIADSIFHTGDTNTAIRFPGNDTFTVETSGSEALRIDGSQRLLMGRTSTAAAANRNSNIQLHSNDASEASITIRRFFVNTDDNAPPRLILARSGSNSDDFTIVADNNRLGEITFAGADGTDARTEAANIRAEVDGTPGSNDMPGRLIFSTTADGASDYTERLRIDSSGQVGIGTDNPSALLHVENNAANAIIARFESNMGTNNSRAISIKSPVSDSASEPFIFDTGNAFEFQCDSTSALHIKFNRNIGIGTDDPATKLVVASSDSTAADMRFQNSSTGYAANNGMWVGINANEDGLVYNYHNSPLVFGTNDDEGFRLDTSGRLLLGTSTSRAVGTERNLQIEGTDGANSSISVVRNSNTTGGPSINIGKSRGTSVNTDTIVQNNDTLGTINFRGADGVDLNGVSAAISAAVEGTCGSDDTPGRLIFSTTADGSNTATERLRIDSSGRVLVGATDTRTNVAGQTLDHVFEEVDGTLRFGLVSGTTNTSSPILALCKHRGTTAGSLTTVNSGDNTGVVMFTGSDGTNFLRSAQITSVVDGTPGTNDMPGRLEFSTTADGASSPTERMRIDSSGTVRIGDGSVAAAGVGAGPTLSITGDAPEITLRDSATNTPFAWIATNDHGDLILAADQGNNASSSDINFRVDSSTMVTIDENGNLELGEATLSPPASGAPANTFFVGRRAAIRSVSTTVTLNGSGEGTFDLGRIHYNDDESFEIFMSICINNTTTLRTSYCKAFCQKVRGTGLTDFFIDRQDSAHSGFSVSSLSSGTAQGVNGHGLNVSVTGGTANTEYRITALIHSVSKNNLY